MKPWVGNSTHGFSLENIMLTNITGDGTTTFQVSQGSKINVGLSGTFGGASVAISYATTAPVQASLDVDDADETPAFTATAVDGGTQGNDYTLALTASAASAPLTVTQDGTDFVIGLATDDGDAATVTTAMTGTDNDITITANAAGVSGNDYSIELLAGSGTTQALKVSTIDNLKFTVLLRRAANAIATTATELVAALVAYPPFDDLITAEVKSGDSGAGVVTALAEVSLAGGGDNFAVTSTSADVVNLINTNPLFSRHFIASLEGEYDGSGLATALAEDAFTGGTQGTFVPSDTYTAAAEAQITNVGVSNWMAAVVTSTGETTDLNLVITSAHSNN